jgi:hypothetical protein
MNRMPNFAESIREETVWDYLTSLSWQMAFGPDVGSDEPAPRNALLPRLMSGEVRQGVIS